MFPPLIAEPLTCHGNLVDSNNLHIHIVIAWKNHSCSHNMHAEELGQI
jgi:predicted DNA-binding protein with PD1-like motif